MEPVRLLLTAILLLGASQFVHCSTADKIVTFTKSQIGSDKFASETDDKSGLFVDTIIARVGMHWPGHVWLLGMTMASAKEWADPHHHKTLCYKLCTGTPQTGDFLAEGNHVAVVTGNHVTTAPDMAASPRGTVKETDWGFRAGQNATCWRYGGHATCDHLLAIG